MSLFYLTPFRDGRLGRGDSWVNINVGWDIDDMGDNLISVDFGLNFNPIQLVSGKYFNCVLSDGKSPSL